MTYVIGIDPGPVTGIALLATRPVKGGTRSSVLLGTEALQVTPGLITTVLDALVKETGGAPAMAVERFVVGPRASRSSTPAAGEVTRDLVASVVDWASRNGLAHHARSAAEVKPWATDARLAAAGLLEPTKGMRHARDAARHALYCAVKSYGLTDPLSRRRRAA